MTTAAAAAEIIEAFYSGFPIFPSTKILVLKMS
jgi:hypothetical protein